MPRPRPEPSAAGARDRTPKPRSAARGSSPGRALGRAMGGVLGGAAGALLLSGCYVTSQGFAYLGLLSRARPVAALLAAADTSEPERKLLERASAVRAFATEELGLRDTKNFTSLARIEGDSLAFVVQACAPLAFERHLWAYPLVGKLPYRGYFRREEAEAEAARLRGKGLDVLVRPVDAFSTLGFLRDPLWSFMSAYGEGELAELLAHEMLHATAFKKGAEAWNEELATFVGREAADAYVAARHGPESPELAERRAARRDAESLAAWLRGTAALLEELYRSDAPEDDKRARKAEILAARARDFAALPAGTFSNPRYASYPMERMNNAWLDLYRLYEGEESLYADYLARVSRGGLRAFVADMAALAKEGGDPKATMRARLAAAGGKGD